MFYITVSTPRIHARAQLKQMALATGKKVGGITQFSAKIITVFGVYPRKVVSIVAVERRETHSPGMFSYASSKMTASLLKLAETDAAYGPSQVTRIVATPKAPVADISSQ